MYKILIIDNKKSANGIKEVLDKVFNSDKEFDVEIVSNKNNIKKLLKKYTFDLVILDINFCKEAMKIINSVDEYLAVLIFSDCINTDILKELINLQAAGFIEKIKGYKPLLEKVNKLLEPVTDEEFFKALKDI